jgi:hypothetical protein
LFPSKEALLSPLFSAFDYRHYAIERHPGLPTDSNRFCFMQPWRLSIGDLNAPIGTAGEKPRE